MEVGAGAATATCGDVCQVQSTTTQDGRTDTNGGMNGDEGDAVQWAGDDRPGRVYCADAGC